MIGTTTLSAPINVLLIEDNPGDARLIQEFLNGNGATRDARFRLEHADRLSTGLARIAQGKVDAVLLDLSLPDSQGLDTLVKMSSQASGVPILVLTGLDDERVGLEAMQQGAQDYLVKGHIDDHLLVRSIRYAIGRKIAEDALRHYAETQEKLLHQLMNAQEAERHRLSMDIHDGPLQSLGVSLMALDRAKRRFEGGDEERALQELQFLRSNLEETVSEIRSTLADLSLDVLTSYGLETALNKYAERFREATGINVELQFSAHSRLPAETELLIYRLTQEALANVRKHSGAQNVYISMQIDHNVLYLIIKDNGHGFDVEEALQKHGNGHRLGLRSMRQRAQAAGGDLIINSKPGKGTTLTFWCPVLQRA